MPDAPPEGLIAGLRKAQSGPLPLQAKGAAAGMFPAGQAGKPLAERAQQEGFVAEVKERREVTSAKGKTTTKEVVVGWGLTAKGLQYLADLDNPKGALEALLPFVQKLTTPAPQSALDAGTVTGAMDKASRECVAAIESAFAGVQKTVQTALDKMHAAVVAAVPKPNTAPDPGPILNALRTALDRVNKAAVVAPVSVPASPPVAPPLTAVAPPGAAQLEQEIVTFVNDWAREKTVGCQFDVLMNHLKQRHHGLTVGTFHDALRKLHDAQRIRFGKWSRVIEEIPEPDLALFLSHKVMYYAQPAHG